MASLSASLVRPLVRRMGRQLQAADTPEKARVVAERWSRLLWVPGGVAVDERRLDAVPALHFTPAGARGAGRILYLHGGGYVFGSPDTYRGLCAQLARRTGAEVYAIDYRLAPEHPFPAAVEDAFAAYRALLWDCAPENVAVAGDSAGGGLAVATMQRARDEGSPLPACGVLFCPWLDLGGSGDSMQSNAASEILIAPPLPSRMAAWYAAGRPLDDPGLSPLFGRHDSLPPLLVQADSGEVLLSDAERFAERAGSAGVDVRLEIHRDTWHVWQMMAPLVSESRRALSSAVAFLSAHLRDRRSRG